MDSNGDKKYLRYFIAPLAVALIVLVVGFYINRSKPDIRFSLSGGLPRELLGETTTENVQLLEIRNIGKEEAHRLRIKINTPLTYHKLKKFSEGDKIEEFPSTNGLEIIYPGLPPQGIIKLILQSKTTIEKADIAVNHSKGKGEEAFTGGTSFLTFGSIAIIGLFSFYSLMMFINGRSSAIDRLESQSDYAPNKILLRRKPIFIDEKRWNSIRTKALGNKIKDPYSSINKAESYKLLCLSGKVDYVTEEEWQSLKHKAIELLTDMLITKINTAWWYTDILELLSIAKPSLFPEKEWAELQDKMNKSYFALKAKEGRSFSDSNSILKEIEQPKPNGILDDFWAKYIEDLKKEYFRELSKDLEFSSTPLHFIKQQNLRVLSDDQVDILKKRAYNLEINKMPRLLNKLTAQHFLERKKPEWIEDNDYDATRKEAEALIRADTLSLLLWDIVYNKALPETKPEIFTEKEWNEVLEIAQRFKKMEEDHRTSMKEQETARIEKTETEKLKEKIEKQLNIIHNILNDPKSIDRIEDYSNVFAPGNFDNLRKISLLLSKQGN